MGVGDLAPLTLFIWDEWDLKPLAVSDYLGISG